MQEDNFELYINAIKADFQSKQSALNDSFENMVETIKQLRTKLIEATKERDAAIKDIHAHWIDKSEEPDEDGNKWYACSNCNHGDTHSPNIEVPYVGIAVQEWTVQNDG